MTTFTLIAYRPDYDEYHGGYRDGGSCSDLEIKQCNSLDEIIKHGVDFYFKEKDEQYNGYYAEWQLTLLIDGRQESYDESDLSEEDWVIRNLYKDKVKEGIKVKSELIRKQQIEAEEEIKRLQVQASIEANIKS